VQTERDKKTILVVDDDKAILESLKLILEKEGYIVDTAETGGEAIEKSRNRHYNLALLDIRLPDMEGTELLTRLNTGIPRMRTVMITGYPSLESTVESLNLGADGYLIKPIRPEKLVKILEEKIREQEAEELKYRLAEEKLQKKTMLEYYEPL